MRSGVTASPQCPEIDGVCCPEVDGLTSDQLEAALKCLRLPCYTDIAISVLIVNCGNIIPDHKQGRMQSGQAFVRSIKPTHHR